MSEMPTVLFTGQPEWTLLFQQDLTREKRIAASYRFERDCIHPGNLFHDIPDIKKQLRNNPGFHAEVLNVLMYVANSRPLDGGDLWQLTLEHFQRCQIGLINVVREFRELFIPNPLVLVVDIAASHDPVARAVASMYSAIFEMLRSCHAFEQFEFFHIVVKSKLEYAQVYTWVTDQLGNRANRDRVLV